MMGAVISKILEWVFQRCIQPLECLLLPPPYLARLVRWQTMRC